MSIKSNIIIDGDYMLHRSVFILKQTNTIKQDLLELLRKDFDSAVRLHPFDNFFFVSDKGKSWRKEEFEEYKGQRKKDDSIDWEQVYKDYDDFKKEVCQRNNVQMIEISGLEGDDIIGYLVNESNKKGYSNLIVAADSDLQQLLTFDNNKNYINILWNHKFNDERLYMPRNYQIFMENIEKNKNDDIFNLDYDEDFLVLIDKLSNRSKVKEVYFEEKLFEKIISGDRKDNINSVVKLKQKELDENGQGVGEKGAEKCYQLFKDTYGDEGNINFTDKQTIDNLSEIVSYYKKVNNRPDIKEVIKNNIKFNYKLLKLDGSQIPENLKKQLENKVIFK